MPCATIAFHCWPSVAQGSRRHGDGDLARFGLTGRRGDYADATVLTIWGWQQADQQGPIRRPREPAAPTEAPFPLALILFSSPLVLDHVGYQWGTRCPCLFAVGEGL